MLEELGAVNIADEAGALSEGLSLESILFASAGCDPDRSPGQ